MRLTRYAVPTLALGLLLVFTRGCTTVPGPREPAEGHGDIDGNVYVAGTTEAILGVLVSCADASCTTGEGGSYYLSDVPEGDQTLTATRDGYEPYSATINVIAGAILYHDVHMTVATAIVHGYVSHAVDGFIEGAEVRIQQLVDYTDDDGYYQFLNVPQGTQEITCTHADYDPFSASIDISTDHLQYDIALTRTTGNTMCVTEDATVKWDAGDASLATMNFGQADSLVVNYGTVTGNRRKHRFFIGYEPLPEDVDPSAVESATLNVSAMGVSGGGFKTILVRHVLSAWTESGITWNDQPDASTAVLCTLFVDESTPTVTIDVLPYYRGEITSVYGLRFALPGDEQDYIGALDWWAKFHSGECATSSLRPFFDIRCAE